MNVVIIEDEPHAAKRLEALLRELMPESIVVARLDSVKKAVQYFSSSQSPDLVLMDVQLSDGTSFDIFRHTEIVSPIIFTTAYDEFALKAFKVNSVDYILKPVDRDEFQQALAKFRSMQSSGRNQSMAMFENIQEVMRMLTKKFKSRFVIKVGEHLKTVEVSSILYFFSQEKATFCCTDDNRKLILDFTLDELEEVIDPSMFFRINRKYFVSAESFSDIIHYTNSRLKLVLKNSTDSDVVVAREKVQEFKSWLDK